ncbi:hypothetical protein FGG08_004472 [Glutinoglossum americanum]|uniref:Uncharacterized protein n=1 Tax=Glutinoglossum americanum TaxID=1670608 RepID=A0A9P8I511_9PEZI|nr:hypothetical protein FGG08_004472 [Glutinoglossum americanum]
MVMSDEIRAAVIETAFELNDIKNERWQDDVTLHSAVGHIRYTRKPSKPRHREGTRDVIFDPVIPGDALTNAINMGDSTEVMYREFQPDLTSILDKNLPLLDEAYAVQSRDFIAQQNVNLTLAARSINHHIAGNAFAAMAHNRRKAMIAQGLHDINRQQSRERVFRNAVGSVTAPPSTATAGNAARASFILGSPIGHPEDESAPELHSSGDSVASVDPVCSLSHSPSLSSAGTLNSMMSGRPAPQSHQGPSDIPSVMINNASPVSPTTSEFSRPHIHLRELTRLSMLVDLDSASKGDESGTTRSLTGDLRPESPKPMSIRQRQEMVRARLASSLGQVGDAPVVEAEADTRDIAEGGNGGKRKRGSWWSWLIACFGSRKGL